MPCIFKPDMHHTWMCIVCHVYACVFIVLFASFRLLLLLASVSFRSCEDSLVCVAPSSSWIRSSPLWNSRQDDRTRIPLLSLPIARVSLFSILPRCPCFPVSLLL